MLSVPTHIQTSDFHVTLIGSGTVGSLVAEALVDLGYDINCIISRTYASAKRLANSLGIRSCTNSISGIPQNTNLILIAVTDSAIPGITREISELQLNFNQLTVANFSGTLTSDVFEPLIKKGAFGISLHPFQTFPRSKGLNPNHKQLFNCYFGLQASEVEGLEIGKKLAHDLGGKVILVPKESKTMYHIAAVMTSNYLVTLTSLAAEVFSALGLNHKEAFKVFEPIMQTALTNMRSVSDLTESLTGPIERGDAEILRRHLSELSEQMPHLVPIYATLGMETVRVAIHKGSIEPDEAGKLLDLLEEAARKESKA